MLLDTNIILRYSQPRDPLYPIIFQCIQKNIENERDLYITSQNLIETNRVATRPAEGNGFGMSPSSAVSLLENLENTFTVLPDSPAIYTLWREQVERFGVSGVQVHDCRLIAFLRAYGIDALLTLNGKDFQRYAPLGIAILNPLTPE